MYEHFQNGELEKAWEINDAILPLCEFLEGSGNMFKSLNVPWNYMGKREDLRYPRLGLTVDEDQKFQNDFIKYCSLM